MNRGAEYILLTIIVLTVTYLCITPLAHRTANLLEYDTNLVVEATNG